MDAQQLYEQLKPIQEAKGYQFNRDKEQVLFLLNGLLVNKKRYGYMACPCRLAVNDRDADHDIICPCAYRQEDVQEYGSCYCGLYVSKAWNDGAIAHIFVPERRPSR